MGRLHRTVTAVGAMVVFAVGTAPLLHAQARIRPEGQTVRLLRGSIAGTVIGFILIQLLKNGLSLTGVTGDATIIVMGVVLILSILFTNFVQHRRGGDR